MNYAPPFRIDSLLNKMAYTKSRIIGTLDYFIMIKTYANGCDLISLLFI